ncbi:histidinol-phosphatase HisJ [Peptacetobacter hominis]|uniref:Histidinol-phosphatase n=1 Tax=Peptacetobacter hominis TaxID=2743610 RepID=A0A544QW45_9FIRM|nr:histidinol-phosphatase HisJ [Peptacetobacter hominis]TQQ84911.1 histidinol-phosphatase HisJ [Peptacetobacter hominis]
MKKDGHIHTEFCPHGTDDAIEKYVEKAIKLGYDEITFTEHMCYPEGFKDPSPANDSVLLSEDIDKYIERIKDLKEKYKKEIKINLGFEVDFIEGLEEKTKELLNRYGEAIDDAILSVHIVKVGDTYRCIDFSKEETQKLIEETGGIDKLYKRYYETLKLAVESDLGKYKPKRIGHFNLIRRFCKEFPYDYNEQREIIEDIMKIISEKGYELDFNVAGLRKEGCGELYIDGFVREMADKYNVKMVLGSDSHTADTIDDYSEYIK